MPYESLRDFIARLEQAGRLKRVSVPVDPHLEMTEIQTRLLAEQGPAILFEQPVGRDGKRYEMPMLVNLFGTVERVAWGMDREPKELRAVGETLAFLKQPEPPGGWREAVEMFPLVKTVLAMQFLAAPWAVEVVSWLGALVYLCGLVRFVTTSTPSSWLRRIQS